MAIEMKRLVLDLELPFLLGTHMKGNDEGLSKGNVPGGPQEPEEQLPYFLGMGRARTGGVYTLLTNLNVYLCLSINLLMCTTPHFRRVLQVEEPLGLCLWCHC